MKIKDRAKPALPPVPAGQYLAVCVGVYDLGEQYSEKYKNYSPKIMISFDIPSVTIEVEGKLEPRQLSREFTISGKSNSKLREFISSWNGVQYSDEVFAEFDPLTQIGKPAMINVLMNETGEYANINTIMPLFPGLPAPVTNTPMKVWDMDKWDDKAFAELPGWVQEKIKKSSQYQKEHVPVSDVAVQVAQMAQGAFQMPQNIQGFPFGGGTATPQAPVAATPLTQGSPGNGLPQGFALRNDGGDGGSNEGIATTSVRTGFAMTGGMGGGAPF